MGKSGKLAKNTLLYAIGSLGSKVLTFLIVPLYTYYIDTNEMGVYDAIITTISLFAPVIVLSIYEGVYRWSIQSKSNAGKYIRYGLKFEIRNLIIVSLLFWVICFVFPIPYPVLAWLYTVQTCLHSYFSRITRALGNTKYFTISGIIYTTLFLLGNCLFIIVLNWGIKSLLISGIIAGFFVTVLLIILQRDAIFKSGKGKVSDEDKKGIIKYSVAITPNDICWWIVGLSDRYALIWFISTSANGIYSISQKFPTVIAMLTSIFYMAWQDHSLVNYEKEDKDRYYTEIFRFYSKFLLCGCLCLIPFTKFVVLWLMADSYKSAWMYVAPLYLGTVFSAFASFYGVGYLGTKKTNQALITTIIAAIVNVGINIVLMPLFPEGGIWIASLSTLISYFVLYVVRVIQTRKFFTIKIEKKIMIPLAVANVIYGIAVIYSNTVFDVILFALALAVSVILLKDYMMSFIKLVAGKIRRS